jgi:hypothetical protein
MDNDMMGRLSFVTVVYEFDRIRKVTVARVECSRKQAPELTARFKADNPKMTFHAVWSYYEVI